MSKSTFFYTMYKMTASVSEKGGYFTKEIIVRCYDVKFSAHLRSVGEKYHVVIISLAIDKMKFYPHARQMHWWMSPYELHFILFTLQTATWSLYFVFNSPIMFSLSFDCWQHAMLLQMFHFGRVSRYLGSRVHISKAYLPRKDWSFKLQKMGVL